MEYIDINSILPVPNIFCIGLNYRDHADENKAPYPKIPPVFMKANTSVITHNQPIILPKSAPNMVDFEAELVVVIGKKCENVSIEDAYEYILGYTCGNDISARDVQFETDEKQWIRGKSFNTFAPIGPHIVKGIDPMNLEIILRLNNKVMQHSNTKNLIHSVPKLVAHLSQDLTLLPGTLIFTGTPGGVGHFRKPPVYLKEGDIVEVEIEKIGILRNIVVSG